MTTATLPTKPPRMPFRARMKKAFGRTSSSRSGSQASTTASGHPIEYYRPHEVPKSKYKGPWNQEHQDNLSSFEWSWGRKSSVPPSEYSPAQTRGNSRANSKANSRRNSWLSIRRPSTKGSGKAAKVAERAPSRVGQVPENPGDDDVTNVGGSRAVSRAHTREKRGASFGKDDVEEDNELEQQQTVTLAEASNEHMPFTEDELTKALTEATLKPPRSRD